VPDRGWPSTLAALAAGLVLGVLVGGLAGLLRAPKVPQERAATGTTGGAGAWSPAPEGTAGR